LASSANPWAAKYDEFGAMTLAPGASIVNNLRFAGQYFDQESGLHYNFRRYYDPGIGRYITEDPIGLEGGINLYAYVNGDPGNRIDPTGEVDAFDFTKAAIKFVARRNLVGMAGEFIFEWAMCFAGCMGMSTLIDFINGDCLRPGEDAGPCAISCAVPPLLRRWKWFKPPPCFRNSFPGDTLVHTEEGLKPIKDIKVGDKVLAWAEWKDETAYKPVTEVITGEQEYELIRITLDNGEVIEATPGHPLYVQGVGWRDARRVQTSGQLDLTNGRVLNVTSVSSEQKREQVFNLAIEDYHTFAIGSSGIMVHNAAGPINPKDIRAYADFAKFVGDDLVGHEMVQNAWLKAHGYLDAKPRNPSVALPTDYHRNTVNPLQKEAGLWNPANLAKQTPTQNIRANIEVLKKANLDRDVIAKQAKLARKFVRSLKRKPCR